MALLREVFSQKEYDYEIIIASWPDAPKFTGFPKKDGPVDDWLRKIKAGCRLRKAPKEMWHIVASNYLSSRARQRYQALRATMKNLHGGTYQWDWKKFKIAMIHMCWETPSKERQGFKAAGTTDGWWWILGKVSRTSPVAKRPVSPDIPSRTNLWLTRPVRKFLPDGSPNPVAKLGDATSRTINEQNEQMPKKPLVVWWPRGERPKTIYQFVPIWLLRVTHTLDALTSHNTKHPKTMSIVAAALFTSGATPSLAAHDTDVSGLIPARDVGKFIGSLEIDLNEWLAVDPRSTPKGKALSN
ncbi:hypothetical protein NLI96_g4512 [Meripilus lineatus]|uniref:Uncharacterized protein n=1 Tax=Meripilus lineatus TaxID=2056292 RepID=A0AAD5V519_9APHY|nr:hypothetical protein NLI96_g4512 [Physisporinus lineatus]